MKKYVLGMVLAVLLMTILACGGGEDLGGTSNGNDGSGEPSTGNGNTSGTTTLTVTNNTITLTFCFLYISSTDSTDWGGDKLQGNQIRPGDIYTIEVEPGIYDLKVEDCNNENPAEQNGMNLNYPQNWILIENAPPGALPSTDGSVTLTIQNARTDFSLCFLYMEPVDNPTGWGEDLLAGNRIDPGGEFSLLVTPGFYNIKVVDCNWTSTAILENQDVSRLLNILTVK